MSGALSSSLGPIPQLVLSISPAHAAAVTPSDTVALPVTASRLYVGSAGALTVITAAGQTVAFAAVPAGTTIDLQVTQVKATGTVASSIVALW